MLCLLRAKQAALSNCTFVGNVASGNGAAVFQEATPGSLSRCTMANNKAQVSRSSHMPASQGTIQVYPWQNAVPSLQLPSLEVSFHVMMRHGQSQSTGEP